MKIFDPTHPGEILKEIYIDGHELTINDAAKAIGVTRTTLSRLINKHQSMTPEMALRLGKAFDTQAEMWLNLQRDYDLWETSQNSQEILKTVRRVQTPNQPHI